MPLSAARAADALLPHFEGLVEHWDAAGAPGPGEGPAGLVLICDHASNVLPLDWPALGGDLGLSAEAQVSHAAWDIGALGLARGLAARLAPVTGGTVLVSAPLSRLAYDLNRAPDHPAAMPPMSEVHEVPGNRDLTAADRLARTEAICLPFHATLATEIARLVARGRRPALIAVHSFTPVYFGMKRAVEFGVIHDDDQTLTHAVIEAAKGCGLDTRLNEPYSAAGDVTHTIRLHAVPLRLPNTMLEIRNDLIADAPAQEAMADRLAPVLAAALTATGAV
ncbi:N-formylglutamate amidohydrolase [Pararhodobacter aggregans]|uniref:N-formylglutamate amidohydrolase n=1 Tax=Pararhodobacter aggregans TaxID=404875 RepID=A0A2T7UNJ1_9RHOB|nr:N-formylglutamate amidohydrolase [Pararhodobacter aggregans]PTX00727.1 putative N-formylglutamate amidohydrolase [Pararhodobacter aggregans]PVE46262.1 N-formylglutamate amidohydrolase [Pararhodobacter aggregans]